jgi:hypothetical protein
MAKKKKSSNGRAKKQESDREILARYKREFTAADLRQYEELDWGKTIPVSQVMAELEAIHKEVSRKQKKA